MLTCVCVCVCVDIQCVCVYIEREMGKGCVLMYTVYMCVYTLYTHSGYIHVSSDMSRCLELVCC